MTDIARFITKMKTRGLVPLLSILLVFFATASQAEMYKWVDKDGNVNYSETPPPAGIVSTTIKPPPEVRTDPAKDQMEQRMETLGKISEQRQKQGEELQKTRAEKEVNSRLCEQAKSRLASYERPRVSVAAADGNTRVLAEEERIKEVERSREQIKELCK